MSITSFFATYTEYPMFLNAAGRFHQAISYDCLNARAHRIDLKIHPDVSNPTLRLRHAQAYALRSCAQAMQQANSYLFLVDFAFGNMSLEPCADNFFRFRQTGGLFRFVIDTVATQWYSLPAMAGVALVCTSMFHNDGFDEAIEKGCVLATMPIDFLATQVSSMMGVGLKVAFLLPIAALGALRGLYAADQLIKQHQLSMPAGPSTPTDAFFNGQISQLAHYGFENLKGSI